MQIALENFRCFHHPSVARIAPITILLGENSAGKTSFLAGLYAIYSMLESGTEPNFNAEPFLLGAYEQIANTRPGLKRAECFKFRVTENVEWRPQRRDQAALPDLDKAHIDMIVTFGQSGSQPTVTDVHVTVDNDHLSFHYDLSNPKVRLGGTLFNEASIKLQRAPVFRLRSGALHRKADKPELIDLALFFCGNLELAERFFVEEKLSFKSESAKADGLRFSAAVNAFRANFRYPIVPGAPVRTRPRRTYDPVSEVADPEGGHAPMLLARLKAREPLAWNKFNEFLAEFGTDSGLFQKLDVRRRGKSDSDPFQIVVNVSGATSNLIDVGYGVSQILPILVDLYEGQKGSWHLLQQPEVHLHPRGQAELASLLGRYVKQQTAHVIAETHSEYIIDRLMILVREGRLKAPRDLCVLHFWREGSDYRIDEVEISEKGEIVSAPPSYREFFRKEMSRMFELEA
jgi:predicted ATPase